MLLAIALLSLGQEGGKRGFYFKEKIGVVDIVGPILESTRVMEQLVEFRKDPGIKGILLRVDSPGGGVGPSQEIYREILRTREEKPIVASMGSVAASGGYYVCSPATKIVANPSTITGSIGVIMEFMTFEKLLKKIGLEMEVLKKGEYKDVGSPHRALTPEEKEMLLKVMGDIHEQFIEDVSKARSLEKEKVRALADGRIFTGNEALTLGLVDAIGNQEDAVDLLKKLANIRGEPQLVYPRAQKRLLDLLIDSLIRHIIELSQGHRFSFKY